ncbi:MAG: outer membrane beta-barrel protein [Acidobacteriia bacterium]|nr:outer membrane beta-barrel protein [Terriglobia bacterium]
MKLTRYSLALLPLLLAVVPLASAQSSFDLNIGFGTARAGSNGGGIDNLLSPNAGGACVPSALDPNCQATPGLGGFFLGLGGDLMLQKHFGIGAEVNLTPAKSDYGPLQFRQTFYDVNGILAPINEKRVQLQLQGGIGGAKTGFSFTQNSCVGTAICTTQSQPVGNSNHFQVHAGVGLQIFVTEHVFIRPQFDLHYVPNFNQVFGRNSVPAGTIWIGYSFGDRS